MIWLLSCKRGFRACMAPWGLSVELPVKILLPDSKDLLCENCCCTIEPKLELIAVVFLQLIYGTDVSMGDFGYDDWRAEKLCGRTVPLTLILNAIKTINIIIFSKDMTIFIDDLISGS